MSAAGPAHTFVDKLYNVPLLADKIHAATLHVVYCAPFYSGVRLCCAHCLSPIGNMRNEDTFDCRLGKLSGCGARYCSLKCLVANAAHDCADIQNDLCALVPVAFYKPHLESAAMKPWNTKFAPSVQNYLILAERLDHQNANTVLRKAAALCVDRQQNVTGELIMKIAGKSSPLKQDRVDHAPTQSEAATLVVMHTAFIEFAGIALGDHFGLAVAYNLYFRSCAYAMLDLYELAITDAQYARQLYREKYGEYSVHSANCWKALAAYTFYGRRDIQATHDAICAAGYIYTLIGEKDLANTCRRICKSTCDLRPIYTDADYKK